MNGHGSALDDDSLCIIRSFADIGRSTRADRFASPFSCARKANRKRSAKAAISGAGTIWAPVPEATTTWVLSIMHVAQAPVTYCKASVRNTLHVKRVKTGDI